MDFQNYDEVFDKNNYPIIEKCKDINSEFKYFPELYGKCLCLSGKKFRFCCKQSIIPMSKRNRFSSFSDRKKKLPSYKVEHKSIGKKNISFCLAKNFFEDCDDKNIVHSHTLAKNSILKTLSNNKKLIRFNDHNMIYNLSLDQIDTFYEEITNSEASVTVSFCKTHDAKVFEDIENDNYQYEDKSIINLEYALKATSFDIYRQLTYIKYMSELIQEDKAYVDNDYLIDYKNNIDVAFSIKGCSDRILKEIENIKNNNLNDSELKSVYIKLPVKKINFSLSECVQENSEWIFTNIVNAPEPIAIYSSFDEDSLNRIRDMKKKIESEKKKESKKESLLELFFCSLSRSQNIFFNSDSFKNLNDISKMYMYLVHRFGYDYDKNYYYRKYVNYYKLRGISENKTEIWKNIYDSMFEM